MTSRIDKERDVLFEAFLGGWQAALGRTITSPHVINIVEQCFDSWLEVATDEIEVLGLSFRRRENLPLPRQREPSGGALRRQVFSASASPDGRRARTP